MLRLPRRKDQTLGMLQEVCGQLVLGADLLGQIFRDAERAEDRVQHLKEVEQRCDETVHEIVRALDRSYFSFVNREDWHALASRLDDVLDFIHRSADRLLLYRITSVPAAALELSDIILEQSRELSAAVADLPNESEPLIHCDSVKRLRTDAGRIVVRAVGELFSDSRHAITVIKLKDLYGGLESATDSARRAADLIEGVALKRGAA